MQADVDTPLYSVAAVTRHTGVPAVTLRAWERRYGFPRPQRAPSGRRLYTQRDIWTIRSLRSQTDQGVPISRAIALVADGLAPPPPPGGLVLAAAAAAHQATPDLPPLDALVQHLVSALLDLAPARADAVLSAALSQLAVEDVCLGVMQPALNEIGSRWHAGQASIAQEHFASAVLRSRLLSLLNHALAAVDHPTILAACPPGEWHELGLLMVCLFLARRGDPVRYLGANLPADDLARAVAQTAPRLVILSAQTEDTAEALVQVMHTLCRLPPPRPLLAYGGWIFSDRAALRARTPGTFLGEDARAAVASIDWLLSQ